MGTAYDPGTAGQITPLGKGQFEVSSWREEGLAYFVDLARGRCTCPAFRRNGSTCKHLTQTRAARFEGLVAKAKSLPESELEELLPKYEAAGQLDIAVAIRTELFDRQQAAVREQALKAIFS